MKLIELHQEYLAILSEIEETGGELSLTHDSRLDSIAREIAQNADKADFVFRKLEFESNFYAAEIKRLQNFKRSIDNAHERMREFVKTQMVATGVSRIEGETIALTISKTKPTVVIEDETALAKEYFDEVVTHKLNKTRVSEDLKLGSVKGAHLEESFALRVTRSKK